MAIHDFAHVAVGKQRRERCLNRPLAARSCAVEELRMEISVGFVRVDPGIVDDIRPDHATYIPSPLEIQKEGSRANFAAGS